MRRMPRSVLRCHRLGQTGRERDRLKGAVTARGTRFCSCGQTSRAREYQERSVLHDRAQLTTGSRRQHVRWSSGRPSRRPSCRRAVPVRATAEADRACVRSPRSVRTLRLVLLAVLLVRYGGHAAADVPCRSADRTRSSIIWLTQPGPGGGGGGGGNQMKEPPRKAELPGKDKLTVPVDKAPTSGSGEEGAHSGRAAEYSGQEPGRRDRFARRRARSAARTADVVAGLGNRRRRRNRDAAAASVPAPAPVSVQDPAAAPGAARISLGNGVTLPSVLHEERPQYTSDAMRAKVQGTVLLQCVVRPDGTVGDVQVVRSLDSTFGLDQQAMKAARKWRFRAGHAPGRGRPRPHHHRAHLHAPLEAEKARRA